MIYLYCLHCWKLKSQAKQSPEITGPSTLPPGWIESRDPTTGCVYYYNEKSGKSQWEKPVGPSLNSQPQSSSDLLEDWQEVLDETSGCKYYYNSKTNISQWEHPGSSQKSAFGQQVSIDLKKCSGCGGWGLGLVQSWGYCCHCTRVLDLPERQYLSMIAASQYQATNDWTNSKSRSSMKAPSGKGNKKESRKCAHTEDDDLDPMDPSSYSDAPRGGWVVGLQGVQPRAADTTATMLSYGSSSTTIAQGYDVFMSFRGEDTRTGFTSHLYDALIRNDIRTYKDDKTLEIGKPIASELLEAIETSRIAVVVLSSNFATSKWCLEEIAKIANCMKRGNLIVIPIFYHVSPSDVRHQSNNFEQGFANHAADTGIAPQKVEEWRDAFKEVGAVSGLHVTEHSVEAEVVSEVVSKIISYLPDTMPVDLPNNLVGIKSRVDEVKTLLRMECSEVLFIGICGMSGVGKTTLAEAVYRDIKRKFEKSCIIENIKDISKQNHSNDLCKLQQKLLDEILKKKSIHVPNVTDGQILLGTKLRGLKVIIILDDVNHIDQLIYLAGRHEWFGPGSRIIVTTTNRDLLKLHKINDIYWCEEMKPDEALSLFSQSAFEQSHPIHGYEKLSDDIVKLAGGLPLALKVYGNQLRTNIDVNYWKDTLEMLKEYPEEEVLGRLEVVYARLNENQRYVFIYIACFLKGRNKDLIKDLLRNIGLYSERGITDLINKSLITINVDDSVWMHDLLQQMCWKILRTEAHRYDGKHIAIKSHEDALTLNIQGAQTVEVFNQDQYKCEVNDCFADSTCLSKMRKLKFLRISNAQFPEGLSYLSNDLRIIEWYGCSLKSLPSMFEPRHIYELEMCSSQLKTLWKKDLELPNLRSINLSFSMNLTDIPNLTSAPNLVKLNLEGCTSLTSLHESVLLHKCIYYLNLKGCTCLQSLGRNRMEMEALEALVLSGCSKLENIPEFGKNMKRLEHLYVDGTKIKRLPENLGELYDLRNLDASGTFIQELPSSISRLKKLRLLHVNNCLLSFKTGLFLNPSLDTLSSGLKEVDLSYCNLSVVPDGIGLLCHLITLNLSENEFISLPASIGLLSKLRMLCLNNCKRLQSLPKLSLVDEDMDYGPRGRFNYYFSAKEVDVSKFDALSVNNRPTVLCLNCSKLAVEKRGSYLAEKILNNYLELRSLKYWMTPEAVFQIVGIGSEFPAGFEDLSYKGISLTGPWIGVAICAVISAHHVDAYMKANHMVTACIRLGAKHMKIPINFLAAGSETQVILYWTIADDPQRIAGSIHWGIFYVSFDLEPDSNLHVTKVGVRFIREEYIMCLKRDADSKIMVGKCSHKSIDFSYQHYEDACTANANLYHVTLKIHNFIVDYGSQHDSLIDIFQITKDLLEINPKILRILCEDQIGWTDKRFDYFEYATISLGISVLYKDFVWSLKDINDGWLSVRLTLEQIVMKSRAGIYSYEDMKQHLNDLEATQSVEFSDNFLKMFLLVCRRTFYFFSSITKSQFLSDRYNENMSWETLLHDSIGRMVRDNALPRILPEDILPRVLPEDVLLRMIQEDVFPGMLREDVLTRVLGEDVLQRMLRVHVLWRILQNYGTLRMFPEDLVLRMLREEVLPRMLREHVFREELASISSIPVTCGICMLAVFMGCSECLKERQHITGPSQWPLLYKVFTDVKDNFTQDEWFTVKTHYNCELQISDFCNNRLLLQQLMNKMGRSNCFTKENEEEMMMSVIDKLQNSIHKVSSIIQEMSSHADQYCHDIEEAKEYAMSYSEDSKDDEIISMLPLFNTN